MHNPTKTLAERQTAPEVPPEWRSMLAASIPLRELVAYARAVSRKRFSWHRWESVKQRLMPIAGWFASDPRLRTTAHRDCAFDKLLAIVERRAA